MIRRLEKVVKENENKTAYIIGNKSITYGDLWQNVRSYADYLKRQGSEPVLIYGHKSIGMIESILACLIAGRAYVPVDVSVPILRIYKIIELSNPSLIIKNQDIVIDTDLPVCSLEELSKFADNDARIINNEIAYIMFTSGSTGEPKGVPISRSNLENFLNWISDIFIDNNLTVLNTANFNFDLSVADMFYSIFNGHTLVGLEDAYDFENLFSLLKGINLIVATPTFIKLCLVNGDFNQSNYPDLKHLYFCGEELEVSVVKKIYDRFDGINIINAYGPTEATSAVSAISITKDMLNNKVLPIGKKGQFATEIEIINEEIVLKGKSVFNGYLNNILGGYFLENGINCYRTGDIGYFENDLLYFRGRKDNQIKYKGYRIELDEIKNAILNTRDVYDCVVLPKYNEDNLVKLITAYVVCKNGISKEMIISKLKSKLPIYMIPKNIIFLDELPVNNNGKIDRKKLMSYD